MNIQFFSIMDKRQNNGGARDNAGRKKRSEEQALVERLTPFDETAFEALKDNLEAGEKWAVELFFKYRFGMPRQMLDVTSNGNDITAPLISFKKFNPNAE